jgi:hypothetical protein
MSAAISSRLRGSLDEVVAEIVNCSVASHLGPPATCAGNSVLPSTPKAIRISARAVVPAQLNLLARVVHIVVVSRMKSGGVPGAPGTAGLIDTTSNTRGFCSDCA